MGKSAGPCSSIRVRTCSFSSSSVLVHYPGSWVPEMNRGGPAKAPRRIATRRGSKAQSLLHLDDKEERDACSDDRKTIPECDRCGLEWCLQRGQVGQTRASLSDWGEGPLKKVPAPYGAAHPHADLLKCRSLILDAPLGEAWQAKGQALPGAIMARCAGMLPVWRLLNAHLR